MKDFDALDLPYSEESEYAYIHNREFNITIIVDKKQENETNNDFIRRVNIEINKRFDFFEANVKEWNRFNSLSFKEKEKEIINERNRYVSLPRFNTLSKADKKEIIDRVILYKSEIPKL